MKYLLIFIATFPIYATENDYVNATCKGQREFMLSDRTRVDCLTDAEAQEWDFGHKSYEAIGQSLWYASNTGRRAAIVLITKSSSDIRGLSRAIKIIRHYNLPITIYSTNKIGSTLICELNCRG